MAENAIPGTTAIMVVRHGQSEWNEQHRWQGRADPPLSEFGQHQATMASERIGQVDVIVSSPLQRAFQTASIIAEHLGVGPVGIVDELVERDIGTWSGMTKSEIDRQWPGWVDQGKRLDDWESDVDVEGRAVEAMAEIHRRFGQVTVLAVTHHGIITNLERHLGVRGDRLSNLYARVVYASDNRLEAGEAIPLLPDDLRTGGGPHKPVIDEP